MTNNTCFVSRLLAPLSGKIAVAVLLLLSVTGLLAPWLPLADPSSINLAVKYAEPSAQHWLGTDVLGRDIFARIVWGIRASVFTALVATAITAAFGALYGGFSAISSRKIDAFLMRFCDLWMSFPSEVMILAVVGMLGPGLENVIIGCFVAKWPWYARMIRSIARRLSESGFVIFSEVSGTGRQWILCKHLLPNIAGEFFVLATLDLASVLLMISALSFLGLGVSPPSSEWGMMLAEARNVMTLYPWQMLPPGLMILVTVVSLHFLGDALAGAFDPKNTAHARRSV